MRKFPIVYISHWNVKGVQRTHHTYFEMKKFSRYYVLPSLNKVFEFESTYSVIGEIVENCLCKIKFLEDGS